MNHHAILARALSAQIHAALSAADKMTAEWLEKQEKWAKAPERDERQQRRREMTLAELSTGPLTLRYFAAELRKLYALEKELADE